MEKTSAQTRCPWAGESDLMQRYHDEEWAVPTHDDGELFERLILECFQAGLSWRTILHKRENFRRAFDDFDPARIALYDEAKISSLLADAGIVRNRLKIRGTVKNAQAFLALTANRTFDDWLWSFVGHEVQYPRQELHWEEIPTTTEDAQRLSRALKAAGFTFVGPTICYAFMQSVGMVDDHISTCFRYRGP